MKQKNALHINSYFLSNKIHYNFYKEILKHRADKFLIPVYKTFKENHIDAVDIDYVFSGLDKKLFFTKIIKVLKLVNQKKLKQDYEYIHAHTLISDGIAAYLVSRSVGKKYVVTVRSTDVDFFIKKSVFFRLIGKKVLQNAAMVFFVSPTYRELIKNTYPTADSSKFYLLPNGIDDYWVQHKHEKVNSKDKSETFNILFVGQIIKRKKLDLLIDFIRKYDDRKYTLNVVGKNLLNLDFEAIKKTITNGNTLNYLGEIKDKEKLRDIYRSNDAFVLLSYAETFGVVYIEALSQGLPIIYTRGYGVDGYFKDGDVGYSCDYRSLDELKDKIDLLVANYSTITKNTTQNIQKFEWPYLVQNYMKHIDANL